MPDESMRERLARALESSAFEVFDRGYTCQNALAETAFLNAEKNVKRARKKAVAALRALREPTEAMTSAAWNALTPYGGDPVWDTQAADIWRAMIDAALGDD